MKSDAAKKRLAKNTVYLYVLSLSSQFISLLTIPYQTRILSPELFGIIGFITGIMAIIALFFNYGFLYSATETVALNSCNKKEISKTYTAVFICKIFIAIASLLIIFLLVLFSNEMRAYWSLLVLYYIAFALAGFLPDFLYRGLEQMKTITIRTVSIRLLSAALIFLFLKEEADVVVLPVSLLVGNAVALFACFWYDKKKLKISLCRVGVGDVRSTFSKGAPFFISRIASTVYQSGNAIVLGAFYPGQAQVGWYSASDKILTIVKQVSSPVADSIYPYMIKKNDYRLALKIMIAATPIIVLFSILLFMFANELSLFVFGPGYESAGNVIRCLIPAMAVIFPTYIICFPILTPMGLSSYANISNVIGMVIQIIMLVILVLTNNLNVYSVCTCASVSEVSVFLFRLAVMIRFKDRMNL